MYEGLLMVMVLDALTPEPSVAVALTVTDPAEFRDSTQRPPDVVSDWLLMLARVLPDVINHETWRSVADEGDEVAVSVIEDPTVPEDDPLIETDVT